MLSRLARRSNGRLWQQLRGYAAQADAVAAAEESPFLRFGNPFPQVYNMSQALAQLPETQVSPIAAAGC